MSLSRPTPVVPPHVETVLASRKYEDFDALLRQVIGHFQPHTAGNVPHIADVLRFAYVANHIHTFCGEPIEVIDHFEPSDDDDG
jgi:hypothetical protein